LNISEGIHDEGAIKSGSSGFFRYDLCVMAKFFEVITCCDFAVSDASRQQSRRRAEIVVQYRLHGWLTCSHPL